MTVVPFEVAKAAIHGLGVLSMMAIAFGMLERSRLSDGARNVSLGVLFGAGSIAAMLQPALLPDGVLIDLRSIVIGLGAAFGGIPAAVIATVFASAYRLWLGGDGSVPGVYGIIYCAAIGVLWARSSRLSGAYRSENLVVFGALVSFHCLFLALIPSMDFETMLYIWSFFAFTCVVSSATLGALMVRERRTVLREHTLRHDSSTDGLTSLPNRRAFDRELKRRTKEPRSTDTSLALLVIDVDHFKAINDSHGHPVGDSVLRELACQLAQSLREGDIAARIGGEEFGVILSSSSPSVAMAVAERIRARTASAPIETSAGSVDVTVSIGVAWSAGPVTDVEQLFAAADRALYRAKRSGRNRVEVGEPEPERLAGVASQSAFEAKTV